MGYIAHEQIAVNRQLGKESSINKYLQQNNDEDIYKSLFSEGVVTEQYRGLLKQTEIHYSPISFTKTSGIGYESNKVNY